jgi:crossover junction endodeoxyribonuclease RuvC
VITACAGVIETYAPEAMALERLYVTKNQKTAMQVAEARGALIYCAAVRRLSIHEYTPGQVKSATAGWGRSDKQGVERMVRLLTGVTRTMLDDEVDAIAVGLTHLAHARVPR